VPFRLGSARMGHVKPVDYSIDVAIVPELGEETSPT
jgi:hypothetical protein